MAGTVWLVASLTLVLFCTTGFAQANLVGNGDFERTAGANQPPDRWASSGAAHVKQQLTRDVGREGKGFSAKLTCTEFGNGTPSSHAMICQAGVVSLQRGKWYRLTFWAKGEGVKGGVVQVAISNTKNWSNTGLSDGVTVRPAWQRFELLFQASQELAAADSRLQFWFNSTGAFWLDDVELLATDMKAQQQPQLATDGRVNFLPNSSFECATAGWGSYSPDLRAGWQGNLYQLVGDLDATTAAHGKHSLRIRLSADALPTFFFDYFDPVRQPARCVLAAHHGWAPVQRGKPYTLSAFLKADKPNVTGVLFIRQAQARPQRKDVPLTTDWQRYVFTFTAETEFAWAAVGLDLAASKLDAATVWVDAVQLEAGAQATPYQPCQPVEVLATPSETDKPLEGPPHIPLDVHAFNNAPVAQTANTTLVVSDFWDAEVVRQTVSLSVPPQGRATKTVDLPFGKYGFYRVQMGQQHSRCAVIKPHSGNDSRFGMNHAYPWDFMLPLAHQAGILWWRDWTVQWRTVQPERGAAFDFREPDAQIDRVLKQSGQVLALFPFPSSAWTSTATPAAVDKIARNEYEKRRLPLAFKPNDEPAFARYVAESVRHYRKRLRAYQVFNESLYTSYALPASAGHTMDDYVRLCRLAYTAIKAEQPDALVVGGMGIWADNKWTRDFVEAGGLKFCDVLDLHVYPKGQPEFYADSLAQLWKRMKERGEAKPIWVTELGCYGDDDPAITPLSAFFGDAAMRRSLHPSEREATEWLVKFAALFFVNGGEKIFLHAGTCGEINGQDVGGVFFEYGGAPRKMLAGVAAMATLLPADAKFDRTEQFAEKVVAHWFRTPTGQVAVAWSTDGETRRLPLPASTQALDLMGNALTGQAMTVTHAPIYLIRK
ncbi:MAG: hypothetical protein FJ279_05740 [Planctomycetes bacterium]|nr:hypothetical protein [Planctomycetota bacterium]